MTEQTHFDELKIKTLTQSLLKRNIPTHWKNDSEWKYLDASFFFLLLNEYIFDRFHNDETLTPAILRFDHFPPRLHFRPHFSHLFSHKTIEKYNSILSKEKKERLVHKEMTSQREITLNAHAMRKIRDKI